MSGDSARIRILTVDDHLVLREGVAALVNPRSGGIGTYERHGLDLRRDRRRQAGHRASDSRTQPSP